MNSAPESAPCVLRGPVMGSSGDAAPASDDLDSGIGLEAGRADGSSAGASGSAPSLPLELQATDRGSPARATAKRTERISSRYHSSQWVVVQLLFTLGCSGDLESPQELVLGTETDDGFEEFPDGGFLEVFEAPQGGTWVHVSLRAYGVSPSGLYDGRLEPDIGENSYAIQFRKVDDDTYELHDLRIPFVPTTASIARIDEAETRVVVRYTPDDQATLRVTRQVRLFGAF